MGRATEHSCEPRGSAGCLFLILDLEAVRLSLHGHLPSVSKSPFPGVEGLGVCKGRLPLHRETASEVLSKYWSRQGLCLLCDLQRDLPLPELLVAHGYIGSSPLALWL